jgi:transcriptional antiterminator RfaH
MLDTAATPSLHQHYREAEPAYDPARRTPCGCLPWAVVYTYPQTERWAAGNLTQRGYDIFLPVAVITRRDRGLRTLIHRVETPLFPRYLFVRLDGHWSPIHHAPGVHHLIVSEPGKPAHVPEAIVSAIQDAIAERAATTATHAPWAPGDAVRLASGALAGHSAVILSVRTTNARVAVLVLGALREAVVPLSALSPRE